MPQLTITQDPAQFRAGMIADNGPVRDFTLANEEASAVLSGRAVMYGTDPEKQFLLPTGATPALAGVIVTSQIRDDLDADGVAPLEEARIARGAVIAVETVDAVTPGGTVFLTTAVGPDQGKFGAAGDVDVSAFCEWRTSTAAAGLAALEINLK